MTASPFVSQHAYDRACPCEHCEWVRSMEQLVRDQQQREPDRWLGLALLLLASAAVVGFAVLGVVTAARRAW